MGEEIPMHASKFHFNNIKEIGITLMPDKEKLSMEEF